ncbi:WD40 repeat domain-containing protein [Streptomyces sp. NPDC050400]|uniref:WD40 repeat domain-containing protein n=1 Tax=Streptomyces sp. NPDC050400 TaxID=3365610 RepID=UPI00378FAD4D
MTDPHDTARDHALGDDGAGEAAVHARIAARLAALSADPGQPPPPYARRHLARHAALGHVLDDARVPPQALAWDTGGGIRALLHHSPACGPRHWLTAWSAIEPYLRDAPLPSRMASLHLAHIALTYPDTPRTRMPPEAAPPADSPLTAHFTNWRPAANIWATLPATPTRLLALDHPRHGPQIAVATTTGTLEFLDAATAHPVGAPIAAHSGEIRALHLSPPDPDGRQYLVTAGTDGTVRLWDAHRHAALGCHTDSTWFDDALCGFDDRGDLTVWAVNGRSETVSWAAPGPSRTIATAPPVLRGALTTVIDTDGERVLVHTAHDLTVHHLDGTVRAVHPLPTPARTVTAGGEPGLFYAGHADGSITSWSTAEGRLPATAPGHGEPVKDLCRLVLDEETVVLAAARGRTVTLWEPATGTVAELRGHTDTVTALAALPDSPDRPGALLSGAADATLRLWTAADIGRHLTAGPAPAPRTAAATALWHSDGGPLVATAHDTTVRLTATRTGLATTALVAPEPVLALAWARRGSRHLLLWADATGTVRGWDPVANGTPPSLPPLECGAPTRHIAACTSPDGALALLLTASDDYRTRLWDLHTGSLLRTWNGHTMSVKALAAACADDGRPWLATAGTEGVVRLWDPTADEDTAADRIHCDQGIIHALALNTAPAGDLSPFLVTAGDQADVRLWDLATRQPLGPPLTGHHAPVHALATFTAEHRTYVVSAARDGIIHLWDAATGAQLLTLATATPLTWLDATPYPGTATADLALAGHAGTALTSLDLAHPALAH